MAYGYKKKQKIEVPLVNYDLTKVTLKDFDETNTSYKRDYENGDNVTFFKGVGSLDANIMFLTDKPTLDDLDDEYSTPSLMSSAQANNFNNTCFTEGIHLSNEYFTTVVKYHTKDKQVKAKDIQYSYDLLDEEINLVKPKIIVCVGKAAVSRILNINMGINSLEESFIYSKKYNCRVFIIKDIFKAYFKPEYQDKLEREIHMLSEFYRRWAFNLDQRDIKQNYKVINTFFDLKNQIDYFKENNIKLFAVDCEWRNRNFYDGELRSIQFCWKEGEAIYVDLTDEYSNWMFDCPMFKVKELLQSHFNDPDVKYIGHNYAADAVWMKNHLGLEVYGGKCIFDTMFGLQVCDEYDDRKLEKCAAKYTDMGRYDVDIEIWKAKNKGRLFTEEEGYGKIPGELLQPYGCRDVDATFRLYEIFKNRLIKDGTYDYYTNVRHPFVTETFAQMHDVGIPLDIEDTEQQRVIYTLVSDTLEKVFLKELTEESENLLLAKSYMFDYKNMTVYNFVKEHIIDNPNRDYDYAFYAKTLKKMTSIGNMVSLKPYFEHYIKCSAGLFNIGSAQDKAKWLFDVKQHTPVKSTKNEDGLATLWIKVLEKTEEEQKKYTPSVDKSTLKVYADEGDLLANRLLQLTAIKKLTVSFFSTKDDKGLLPYRSSDGFVRCLYSCTETGRPTSFKPNLLNIPKGVSENIALAYDKVLEYFGVKAERVGKDKVYNYDNFNKALFDQELINLAEKHNIVTNYITPEMLKPKPIRWSFKAPDGYAFIDADYVSAEVYAIAYLSNDQDLIDALTGEDIQFGFLTTDDPEKPERVRLAFVDSIVEFTPDVKEKYKDLLVDPNDPRLIRKDNGDLKHPNRDMYWELVESKYYMNLPREEMEKLFNGNGREVYRTAGKIANFLITYGGTAGFLEAQIGIMTGVKQPEGTGDKIMEAFQKTRKGCWQFKTDCEELPLTTKSYISPSGYKRHFKCYELNNPNISEKVKRSVLAPLQRQACNVGMQSLVADSLAIASYGLNTQFIQEGMKARIVNPLYDALYVLAPWDELCRCRELMTIHMADNTTWKNLPGGDLTFKLDFEVTKRWASKPSKEEKEEIEKNYLQKIA